MLRPDWRYVDLEKFSDYEFVKRDYDFFFATNSTGVQTERTGGGDADRAAIDTDAGGEPGTLKHGDIVAALSLPPLKLDAVKGMEILICWLTSPRVDTESASLICWLTSAAISRRVLVSRR
jgi:hypothetical protein